MLLVYYGFVFEISKRVHLPSKYNVEYCIGSPIQSLYCSIIQQSMIF